MLISNQPQLNNIEVMQPAHISTFSDFFNLLSSKTAEDIISELNINEHIWDVECIGDIVYEDEDLYEFLDSLGAEIVDYLGTHVVISSDNGFIYKIPCEDRTNRHGDDLPDETVLFFDFNNIISSVA